MKVSINNLFNILGWKTNRNIIVIESDDWGSLRMPSRDAFKEIQNSGIDLSSDDGYLYNKYDSLATETDLSALFEVLSSVKDKNNNFAVMTPVTIVANPDFQAIKDCDFHEYIYEPFPKTLSRYPNCTNSFGLWLEGVKEGLFVPQFHGREHLNVRAWMRALQSGHEVTNIAFKHQFWGMTTANDSEINMEFLAAFDFNDPSDLDYHADALISGLNLFESLFGYRATYFAPPNGPFSSKLEKICYNEGLRTLSLPRLQYEPKGYGKYKRRIHWLGKQKRSGLRADIRNCFFEPVHPDKDWVDSCMNEITNAFRWKKPAIISSHRLNYIGALYPGNRSNGLKKLQTLLKNIVKHWPDVEFVHAAELGNLLSNEECTKST